MFHSPLVLWKYWVLFFLFSFIMVCLFLLPVNLRTGTKPEVSTLLFDIKTGIPWWILFKPQQDVLCPRGCGSLLGVLGPLSLLAPPLDSSASLTLPTNSPVVFPSWHASCILWQQLYVIVSLGTYSHRQGRDTTLVLNGLMKQKSPFALSPMFSVTPPVVGKRPHQAGQFKTHWLYMYKQFSFKFLLPPSHYVAPLLPSCLPPFLEVTHSGLFFLLLSLVS